MKNGSDGKCILVVEDNHDHAELILESLTEAKVLNSILWIDNGNEAIDYLKGSGKFSDESTYPRPCLILLDLKLPGKDGKEILREVKSDEKTLSIPVIMLTSSGQDRDIDECYNLGANSYITKPISFGDFMEKVQAIPVYWLILNEMPMR